MTFERKSIERFVDSEIDEAFDLESEVKKKKSDLSDAIMKKVEEEFRDHTEEQPYSVVCRECGEELSSTTGVDGDMDATVTVEPCECQKGEES